jgi:hypothetical protein
MFSELADHRIRALFVVSGKSGGNPGNPSPVVGTIFHGRNTGCQQMATNNHRLGHSGGGGGGHNDREMRWGERVEGGLERGGVCWRHKTNIHYKLFIALMCLLPIRNTITYK